MNMKSNDSIKTSDGHFLVEVERGEFVLLTSLEAEPLFEIPWDDLEPVIKENSDMDMYGRPGRWEDVQCDRDVIGRYDTVWEMLEAHPDPTGHVRNIVESEYEQLKGFMLEVEL